MGCIFLLYCDLFIFLILFYRVLVNSPVLGWFVTVEFIFQSGHIGEQSKFSVN